MNTQHVGFRYTNEVVGALVLVAVLIFVVAVVQGGRIREWFNPSATIKVIMPDDGLFGLIEGARVEILGTHAGEVRRIVINPNQRMHAELSVRKAMLAFLRRDSQATIRKQFGVAGAAYLELTRGTGEPLDPEYAVITATADRAPTDTMNELFVEIQHRILPIIDDSQVAIRAFSALAARLQDPQGRLQRLLGDLTAITAKLERGEGAVGRVLSEDALVRDLERLLAQTTTDMQRLGPLLSTLEAAAQHASTFTATLNTYAESLPQLTTRARALLVPSQAILENLRQTTPALPRITKSMADTTESLPLLVLQTGQTLDNLEKLLVQLRSLWLLGGRRSEGEEDDSRRLPVVEIKP